MSHTDGDLVERARRGDSSAFEELVRRHLRMAHAVALSVLGEPADAEDVSQDAFIVALERLDDCRQPERFGAWLRRIVRNRAYNHVRGRKVRRAVPLDEIPALPGGEDAARRAERGELRQRLLDALGELTERQREVVLLHDLEGWKHREIAERLEIAAGTVRAHLHHARRALRARLGTGLYEEG